MVFPYPDGETYDDFATRIAAWLAEQDGTPVIAVTHGIVTRVMRGLYAGLPRATALSLPVPQDRIFHLAGGTIAVLSLVRVHKGVFFSGVARAEDMSAMGDGRIARNGSDNLDGNRQTSS